MTTEVDGAGAPAARSGLLHRVQREGLAIEVKPVMLPGYMRKADAARYLCISIRTLTEWMQKKRVAYSKLSHKVCLFRQADLDAAMGRYRVKAVGE